MTDADEVGIDSDGICVSERGPGELPAARGDLSVLKPVQAAKDKNCQVMGGGVGGALGDSPCALPPLGSFCLGSLYHSLICHGNLVADPHPGSPLSQPPGRTAFSSQFTHS